MFEFTPESYLELYFDVGEAYLCKKQVMLALPVFKLLLAAPNSDEITVKRKLAECYVELGDNENALLTFESSTKFTYHSFKKNSKRHPSSDSSHFYS